MSNNFQQQFNNNISDSVSITAVVRNVFISIMMIFFLTACGGETSNDGDMPANANTNTGEDDDTKTNELPKTEFEIIKQDLELYAFFGKEYSFQPNFGSLSNEDGVSYTIQNKPVWASFDKSTGRLYGFPELVGVVDKQKKIYDRVAFDISIIASKNGKTVSTELFNIISTNENKKNKSKILVLSSKFSNSTFKPSPQEFVETYKRSSHVISAISKGIQTMDATILDIDDLEVTNSDAKAWGATSLYLELAYNQIKKDSKAICVVNDELMALATKILNDKINSTSEEERLSSGMTTKALDFRFALSGDSKNPCKDTSSGEIIVSKFKIPTNIDINQYDFLALQVSDETLNVRSFQSLTNLFPIKQGDKQIPDKVLMLISVNKDTFISKMPFLEFDGSDVEQELQNTYYGSEEKTLKKLDRTIAHEFIHALGVATHDNGLTSYVNKNEIIATLKTDHISSGFEYRNNFSILGASEYAQGIALATKEYLGWINTNDIHIITKQSLNNQIIDFNSKSGKVGAKILTPSGWLYVSFHTGTGYEASMKHPKLINNTKGLLIEFTDLKGKSGLTTSALIIPTKNHKEHEYALKQGETFSSFGVRIDNVLIVNGKLSFDVRYEDGL